MFQKRILSKPKWGAQAVVKDGTPPWPPVATALVQEVRNLCLRDSIFASYAFVVITLPDFLWRHGEKRSVWRPLLIYS